MQQKVGAHLLLIKRILFVLAIIMVLSGHFLWSKLTLYREQSQAQKYAKITAETWVAYAKFNNEPEKYCRYRDSLLNAQDISRDEIDAYTTMYQKVPEKYIQYASLVSYYVDSLAAIEDTNLKADPDFGDK